MAAPQGWVPRRYGVNRARRSAIPVADDENLDIRALRRQMRDQPARRAHGLVGMGGDHNEITTEVGRQRRNPAQLIGPRPVEAADRRRSPPDVATQRLHSPRHLIITRARTDSLTSNV